eukprot:3101959-Ditylum_brightwellii.AAC.1
MDIGAKFTWIGTPDQKGAYIEGSAGGADEPNLATFSMGEGHAGETSSNLKDVPHDFELEG